MSKKTTKISKRLRKILKENHYSGEVHYMDSGSEFFNAIEVISDLQELILKLEKNEKR